MKQLMSTVKYVRKYDLTVSPNFDHPSFIEDFTIEFYQRITQLPEIKTYIMFEKVISQLRGKYDAINNKTLGDIGEGLWNYFYASVISKVRVDLYPKYSKIPSNNIFLTCELKPIVITNIFNKYLKTKL